MLSTTTYSANAGKTLCLNLLLLITVLILSSGDTLAQVSQRSYLQNPVLSRESSLGQNVPAKSTLVPQPLPPGTYSIGTGGYFPTIDSAFTVLSTDGVAGPVTLELIDDLYTAPAGQYGFSLNGPIPGAGPNSRVTIKPAANRNVIIEGSGQEVISPMNTSYLTIDGVSLSGTATLTIHVFENNQYPFNDCIDFLEDSDHNIVQNINFICDDLAGLAGGVGFYTRSGYTATADSNLIENNYIKKGGIGIYVSSFNSPYRASGNIIRGNQIGSETDSLISWGIQVEHCQNTLVENNIVQNLKITPTSGDICNMGINSFYGSGDTIRNNVVHDMKSTAGFTSVGIFLSSYSVGPDGTNNSVYNNMVYDIQSTSSSADSRVSGIQLWHQTDPKIYYNSVYLSGNGANHLGSAALYIYASVTNADVKNNIWVNTRDESPYWSSAIYANVAGNLTSNYNDLYCEASLNNYLVRIGNTSYNTLADWQAAGKDLHSVSEMPNFVAPDLHIDASIPTYLESWATPMVGIDTDFDGDSRNADTPDIGADEFNGIGIPTLPPGMYTVGTGGNFATIQDAFTKLSSDGVTGPVTLELINNLYTAPAGQYGFSLNGPIPGAGPNSRVTLRPAEYAHVTIQGSGEAVLYFSNTGYFTLDGIGLTGSTTLTVHNLMTTLYQFNEPISFIGNCDHNIVQNITALTEDIVRGSSGITFWPEATVLGVPDSNVIQNNFIKKASYGIYIGANLIQTTKATGNIIRGNKVGSETDSLISWGIQDQRTQNSSIEDNIVQNINRQINAGYYTPGINTAFSNDAIIRNNVVYNINSGNVWGSVGILVSGESWEMGNNNSVYNNMVYDVQCSSTDGLGRLGGIQLFNQNNPKVYYNSVYLTGSGNGGNPLGSAALYIYTNVANADVKNNILVNTRDESPYISSAMYDYTSGNLTSDYNDLYCEASLNNYLVRIGNTSYNTLADWQVVGKDLHSVSEMPNFVAPDLHIDASIPTYLESRATSLAGITTDFDGQARNATTPDIGADEFDGMPVGIENNKITIVTEFALEQNYPNPFNPNTRIEFQIPKTEFVTLKIYNLLGEEIATLLSDHLVAGSYDFEFSASNLASGIYYYRLEAGSYIAVKKMAVLK